MSDTETPIIASPRDTAGADRDLGYILGLLGERVESIEVTTRAGCMERRVEVRLRDAGVDALPAPASEALGLGVSRGRSEIGGRR